MKTKNTKYYIVADQNGVIWGIGKTPDKAIHDANKNFYDYDEPNNIVLSNPIRCSKALYQLMQGGWCEDFSWQIINGLAKTSDEFGIDQKPYGRRFQLKETI